MPRKVRKLPGQHTVKPSGRRVPGKGRTFVSGHKKGKGSVKSKPPKKYKLGAKWSSDFDYDGMIAAGMKATTNMGVDKLQQLFESYEDVNYSTESKYLYSAIEFLKKGDKKAAEKELKTLKKILKTL